MAYWNGPTVVYSEILNFMNFQQIRDSRSNGKFYLETGWHLSNFHYGDYNILVKKYDSFAHQVL